MSESDQRPGEQEHTWRDPEHALRWLANVERRAEERTPQFQLLAALLPYETNDELHLLELGPGHGMLSRVLLQRFSRANVLGADISEPLMAEGSRRLAEFGPRFRYVEWDLRRPPWPEALRGPFHAIVSSRAVYNLAEDRKAELFSEAYERLVPGGALLLIDHVRIEPAELRRLYYRVEHPDHPEPSDRHHAPTTTPLDVQLDFMRRAGFELVDVFWKRLDTALFGGFKPGAAQPV